MPVRPQIEITKEELDRIAIAYNHILVMMPYTHEGAKSKAGVIIGFRTDETFEHGEHSADTAEVWGRVYRVPDNLFYDPDDPLSMTHDTDMELHEGDFVWYDIMEAKNSYEVVCDSVVYKSIPYYACYVAKRNNEVIPLNGYVLCQPLTAKKKIGTG